MVSVSAISSSVSRNSRRSRHPARSRSLSPSDAIAGPGPGKNGRRRFPERSPSNGGFPCGALTGPRCCRAAGPQAPGGNGGCHRGSARRPAPQLPRAAEPGRAGPAAPGETAPALRVPVPAEASPQLSVGSEARAGEDATAAARPAGGGKPQKKRT